MASSPRVSIEGVNTLEVVNVNDNEHILNRKTWDPVRRYFISACPFYFRVETFLAHQNGGASRFLQVKGKAEGFQALNPATCRTKDALALLAPLPRLKKAAAAIPPLANNVSTAAVQKNQMGNIPTPFDVCSHMTLPDEGVLAAAKSVKFSTVTHQRLVRSAMHMAAFAHGGELIVTNQRILLLKSCNEGISTLQVTPTLQEMEEGSIQEPKFHVKFESKSEVRFQSIWLKDVRDVELYMVCNGTALMDIAQKKGGCCGECCAILSCFASCCDCCKPPEWEQQGNLVVAGEDAWALKITTNTHLVRVVVDDTKVTPAEVLQCAGVIQSHAPYIVSAGANNTGGKTIMRRRKAGGRRNTSTQPQRTETAKGPMSAAAADGEDENKAGDGAGGGGEAKEGETDAEKEKRLAVARERRAAADAASAEAAVAEGAP